MYTFKTDKISFDVDEEIPWTLDGEFGGKHVDVTIENKNKALKILVPEQAPAEEAIAIDVTAMKDIVSVTK